MKKPLVLVGLFTLGPALFADVTLEVGSDLSGLTPSIGFISEKGKINILGGVYVSVLFDKYEYEAPYSGSDYSRIDVVPIGLYGGVEPILFSDDKWRLSLPIMVQLHIGIVEITLYENSKHSVYIDDFAGGFNFGVDFVLGGRATYMLFKQGGFYAGFLFLCVFLVLMTACGNAEPHNDWFDNSGDAGALSLTQTPPLSTSNSRFTIRGVAQNNFLNYTYVEIYPDSNPNNYYRYLIQGDKNSGVFEQEICLRYGARTYKVINYNVTHLRIALGGNGDWVRFEGVSAYVFTVTNTDSSSDWSLLPSSEVQVDAAEIQTLSSSICGGLASDAAKAAAINEWVTLNLEYDYDSLWDGLRKKQDALSSLHNRVAVCEGYANLTAALARAAGIRTRYLSGYVSTPSNRDFRASDHAWVEMYIGGEWKIVDTTWNDRGGTNYNENYLLHDDLSGNNVHNGTVKIDRSVFYGPADLWNK